MGSPCEVDPPVEVFELENTLIFIFDSADEIDREQILDKKSVLQNILNAFLHFDHFFLSLWAPKSSFEL